MLQWRQLYCKYYKAFTGMECPINSMLRPAEESICPPPEKRQLIVSDKDSEQCDGDRHSSECAYQTVLYKFEEDGGGEDEQGTDHFSVVPSKRLRQRSLSGEDEQGTNHFSVVPSKRPRQRSLSIAAYAVQCATCGKWRLIPTKQKYEELRAQIQMDPFKCENAHEWKPEVTCNDPSDVSQDGSWLWAMDQHNIPQPPPGFERLIAIRGEGCTRFADVYYATPTRRKLRSSKEVENYLKENPEYTAQGVNLSQFSFKIPAPARQDYVRKRAKTNQNDDLRKESNKPLMEEGGANQPILIALYWYLPSKHIVQPIAWSAPLMYEEPGNNNQLVPYNGGPPELLLPGPTETKLGNTQQPPAAPETKLGNTPQPPAA